MTFDISYGTTISTITTLVYKYIIIAEVRAFDMQVNGNIIWLASNIFEVYIVKEFDPAFNDEENFLTLVTLAVKDIFWIDFNLR